ncbi:MAG TPA: inositol monophosphatase family protein [Solirubrobacteraceae bacterium]
MDTLTVAEEAARAAGELLLARFGEGRAAAGAIASKSTPTDLVSDADLAAETAIREILRARVPDDGIRGEEHDDESGTSGRSWIVDPLDGTVNYLYGHPQWCVSVACEGEAGVIFDPVRDELFAAARDRPATLNGRELRVNGAPSLAQALLATGFGYDARIRAAQAAVVARALPSVRDIRRAGSAALDLAWAAAGRVDAYYERGVQPWDIAAGTLICAQAGLIVAPLPADGDHVPAGICVAPPALLDELLQLVA